MKNISKEFLSQNIDEYNKSQSLDLSPSEKNLIIDKMMEDQDLWDTVNGYIINYVQDVIIDRK